MFTKKTDKVVEGAAEAAKSNRRVYAATLVRGGVASSGPYDDLAEIIEDVEAYGWKLDKLVVSQSLITVLVFRHV